jgi:hypothetical protein
MISSTVLLHRLATITLIGERTTPRPTLSSRLSVKLTRYGSRIYVNYEYLPVPVHSMGAICMKLE